MENDFNLDVTLAVKGDCSAFARLYSIVYKDLYHIALAGLHNPQDAADVVSDTVMDAFASVKKLRDVYAFKAWIFRILSNKIKRKQSEYINDPKAVEEDEYARKIGKTNFNFENVELAEEFSKLSDEERMILSMSVLCGYTSDEIAQICKIKSSSVRSKLSRTKEKLRMALSMLML